MPFIYSLVTINCVATEILLILLLISFWLIVAISLIHLKLYGNAVVSKNRLIIHINTLIKWIWKING